MRNRNFTTDNLNFGGPVAAAVAAALLASGSLLPASDARAQGAAAPGDGLDEVVVSARKRDENVQDVPITIDVLNGDALAAQGVFRTSELQFATPGFYVQNFETRATITMRGVGAQIAGGVSSVATHVNGIYQASSAAQLNRLFDIERVEVVKGPQGTLYGRNSTGGALNVISKAPGDEFAAEMSAGYGEFETVRADAAVTAPLGDNWGLRLAGSYLKGDGQLTNVVNGKDIANEDFSGARATLAGDAGPVAVSAFVQYTRDKDNTQPTLIPVLAATGRPLLGYDRTAIDSPEETLIDRKSLLAGISLSGQLSDRYTWRSITGFIDYSDESRLDVNPQPATASKLVIETPQDAEEITQEFQLLYAGDKANWVLGAFYLDDDQGDGRILTLTPPGLLLFNSTGADKTESMAVFGDLSYKLSDPLTLNVGLRVNRDKIQNSYIGRGAIDGASYNLSGDETEPTGRIGVDYKLRDGLMVFGSVSTGFQAGFFQTRVDPVVGADRPDKVDPEQLLAYEVGMKSVLPGGNGYFNASAFYYDYTDMQVTVGGVFLLQNGNLDPSRPPFFYTENAGKAEIYGIDLQLSDVRFGEHLNFSANAEYLNASYKEYNTISNTRVPVSYAGKTLPRAPELSASTAIALDRLRFGESAEGSVQLEYNYRGRTYFNPENTQLNSQSAVGLVNLSARLEFDDGRWGITAQGRNLTNEEFYDFYAGGTFANTGEFRTWELGFFLKTR
jgi:iron complex outermembrane recepter protein